jgi:hypothetical protein
MNDEYLNQKIIKTRLISIYGLPWEGKTFFASFLSYFYNRVYSNVDFFEKWKKMNTSIKTFIDIEQIKYSDTLGVLILDEAWANINARDSQSEQNKKMWRLAMLSRKKNINIVVISQLERMQDVYYREMSFYHFEMKSYFTWPNYLMFDIMIKDRFWNIIANKTLDLIKFSRICSYTYNTLDQSIIL